MSALDNLILVKSLQDQFYLMTDFNGPLAKCQIIYGKRLFTGTVSIYFAFFEKCHHFGTKLPYVKSGFSKNIGGIQKLEFKTNLQHP